MTHPLNKPGISWSAWFFGDRRRNIKPVAICDQQDLIKWRSEQADIETQRDAELNNKNKKRKKK